MEGKLMKALSPEVKTYLLDAYAKAPEWVLPNDRGSHKTAQPIEISSAAVIGGGTMGRGIAISLCLAGYETILVEHDEKALKFCRDELEITYAREIELKRFNARDVEKLRSSLRLTTDLGTLSQVDLVIEAVFEEMNIKKELLTKLDRICKKTCILGSNTSSLDIDKMSSVLKEPSRLVGIHFFNPAHVIKVVEIVFGSHTSPEAVATAFAACSAMEKGAVLVGNCPAFVFNRLLAVYLNQAHKLTYQYGMTPQDIDRIVLNYGFLMGPLTMHDMNGLDVSEKLKRENGFPLNPIEEELLRKKRYGRKTGAGFYKYDKETHKKENDAEVEEIIRNFSSKVEKLSIQLSSDRDVIEFLLFPMVNEGFLCIEEGMISEEMLIDIMFTFGFGWPLRHGGPMRYGRLVGIHRVADTISHWHNLEPSERSYKLSSTLNNLRSKL